MSGGSSADYYSSYGTSTPSSHVQRAMQSTTSPSTQHQHHPSYSAVATGGARAGTTSTAAGSALTATTRVGARQVSDQDVYAYALRVAILHDELARPRRPPAAAALGASAGLGRSLGNAATSSSPLLSSPSTTTTAAPAAATAAPTRPKLADKRAGSSFRPGHGSGFSSKLHGLSDALRSSSSTTATADPGGSSSVRLPKEFLRLFEARVRSLAGAPFSPILISAAPSSGAAGGGDAYASVELSHEMHRSLGAFHRDQLAQAHVQRRLKDSRRPEELVALFVASAAASIRSASSAHATTTGSTGTNAPSTEASRVRDQVNDQAHMFVCLIRETLVNASELRALVTRDLLERIDSLALTMAPNSDSNGSTGRTKPAAAKAPPLTATTAAGDTLLSASSSSSSSSAHATASSSAATNMDDMPHVQSIGRLFGRSPHDLERDTVAARRASTDLHAFRDLKLCLDDIARSRTRVPFSPADFPADAPAFDRVRRREARALQELLLDLGQRNPSLLKADWHDVRAAEPLFNNYPARTSREEDRRSSLAFSSSNASPAIGGASPNGSFRDSRATFITTADDDDDDDNDDDESEQQHLFTFIPPDPRAFYRRLFEIALDHDYSALSTLSPEDDVPIGILSDAHVALLDACALRWRVLDSTRAAVRLALLARKFARFEVPDDCVRDALAIVDDAATSPPEAGAESIRDDYASWPVRERDALVRALAGLEDALLYHFFQAFQGRLETPCARLCDLIADVHAHPLMRDALAAPHRERTLNSLNELAQGLRTFFAMSFEDHVGQSISQPVVAQLASRPGGEHLPLGVFVELLDWVLRSARRYVREYKEPLADTIDVPALFLAVSARAYVQLLRQHRTALVAAASADDTADDDLLGLYHDLRELNKMHDAFNEHDRLVIDFATWFEPYVRRWLAATEQKTSEWVRNAIAHDKFEPEGEEKHSSSVIDLIDSCKSATEFILKLAWPDEVEHARHLTALSHIIARSIEQYCTYLERLFMDEMFPRQLSNAEGQTTATQAADAPSSAWLVKAKMVMQGDKKVEPFTFRPESCFKLNNIRAAGTLLDQMYNKLDADNVARILEEHEPPQPERIQDQRFLFTIKIALGENIVPSDGSASRKMDPFLILSDSRGERVAKTRTLYDTSEPRWDETIDVSVRGDLWLRATVWNRKLVDTHEMVGLAYVHLNPLEYGDFLARDVWLALEDKTGKRIDGGRLLLRISMEGEKDDIQFYFGRAFRSLKRAEADMTRTIVDKMSPFIRHYLSRTNLRALLKTGYNFDFDIDMNRVKGDLTKVKSKFNTFVRDVMSGDSTDVIPPTREELAAMGMLAPQDPKDAAKALAASKRAKGQLTDKEIEDAIGDLFDYFNVTFRVLQENLSAEAWDLVIMRLWKDILATIESMVVPPLSDQPTEMKPLNEREIDTVYKWLKFLTDFFHGGGQGVPLEKLRNSKYRELIEARFYYEYSTDQLMTESVHSMKQYMLSRNESLLGRSKSVYQMRNLGTIRQHSKIKREAHESSGEIILRILRMRPDTRDFLQSQVATILNIQAEQVRNSQRQQREDEAQRRATLRRGGSVAERRRAAKAPGATPAGGRSRLPHRNIQQGLPPVQPLPPQHNM